MLLSMFFIDERVLTQETVSIIKDNKLLFFHYIYDNIGSGYKRAFYFTNILRTFRS
jgi:hypothetical protein